MGSEIRYPKGILQPILQQCSRFFFRNSISILIVSLFIILQTIKEDLKQKHKLEMTQLLLKLSHPLSQLFKLVKLISSFEIVLRKVLFRLLCLKLMSLMIALKRLGTYFPVTGGFRENFLSESLCRTKLRFVKMNSDQPRYNYLFQIKFFQSFIALVKNCWQHWITLLSPGQFKISK